MESAQFNLILGWIFIIISALNHILMLQYLGLENSETNPMKKSEYKSESRYHKFVKWFNGIVGAGFIIFAYISYSGGR